MRVRPGAISFDLDDTLWACDEVIERAERVVYMWLQERAPEITAEFDLEAMRRIRHETAAERPRLAANLTALRRETLVWHAARAGYGPDLADEAVGVFLGERNRVQPFPDVRPVLESLARNHSLVAVTNGNADIERIGLGDLFELAVSAADVGAAKPDPAMFAEVCRVLDLRAGDLLHVGDDPVRDVHAARRFGARTVWVNRFGAEWPGDVPRAHHELDALTGLEEIVAGTTRDA